MNPIATDQDRLAGDSPACTILRHRDRLYFCLVLTLLMASPALAQFMERPLVIKNARIIRMNGSVIESGSVVIKGRVIQAIGADVKIPFLARSVDATGKTVTPGLIDAYSALGMAKGHAGSPLATSKAMDAFNRYATDDLRDALRHGVTTVYVGSRGASGIGGVGAVVQLVRGAGKSLGVAVKEDAALCIDLGSGDSATTRLKTFDRVRKQFRDALKYRESWETYEEDLKEYEKKLAERVEKEAKEDKKTKGKEDKKDAADKKGKDDHPEKSGAAFTPPERGKPPAKGKPTDGKKEDGDKDDEELKKPTEPKKDRKKEVLLRAIDHELPVRIEAHRSADILNALELAREFSLDVTLEGASDAYLVATKIADADVSVVLGKPREMKFAARLGEATNAWALEDAGVTWTVGSGAEAGSSSRFVLLNAMMVSSQNHRLETGATLRRVTIDAADILGLSRKIGHLTQGMQADLVIWSGDPYDPESRVEKVYIAGKLVYQETPE